MPAAPIKLDPVYYGDTWGGLSDGAVTDDGSPPESELATVRMYFRRCGADPSTTADLMLTSDDGEITIEDAAAWTFTVEPVERLALEISTYDWSIEFTDADNVRTTDVTGTLQVLKDPTR